MEKDESGLSAAEEAYFESGGETELVEKPVETPEVAKIEDKDAQAAIEGQQRDEKGKFVPHGALHAEREEHKKTKADLAELRDFKTRMEERWRMLEQAAQQSAEPAKAPPNPDEDIFAYSKWQKEQLDALTAKVTEREQQETQAREQQEYEGKVWGYWQQSAAEYKAENPDFDNAVKWMSESRSNQLKALAGLHPQFRTEQGIIKQINSELKEIVVAAAQNGISPAQYIYDMAKSWGYTGAAAAVEQAKVELPEQLKRVDQAQQANRGVGKAPGSPAGDEMSLEGIMAMPRAEYEQWVKDPANERRMARLMGA